MGRHQPVMVLNTRQQDHGVDGQGYLHLGGMMILVGLRSHPAIQEHITLYGRSDAMKTRAHQAGMIGMS